MPVHPDVKPINMPEFVPVVTDLVVIVAKLLELDY